MQTHYFFLGLLFSPKNLTARLTIRDAYALKTISRFNLNDEKISVIKDASA